MGSLAERYKDYSAGRDDERQLSAVRAPKPKSHGIHPTEFRVLVRPDPVEEKTKGGIILIDDSKEREKFAGQKATLIAVSPAAFSYDDAVKANPPKPGDRVVIAKYAGFDIKGEDGVEYRIIADKDVCAVLA